MADSLFRNLDNSAHPLQWEGAQPQEQSQQHEAQAALVSSSRVCDNDWVARLHDVGASTGGIELDEPVRHYARKID